MATSSGMATSRDVQDIVSKLSSDKAKTRDDGIKLLNTWLEGERSIKFCRFISKNTAKLKLDEIPNSETWPFLVKLLIQCVSLEVSGSKRRMPKSTVAKTLRIVIQRAEETKSAGVHFPLLSVAKTLFTHIYDVLSKTPSFQSEYGTILRHLLAIREYQFHIRKRTYCSLVLLYMDRVETGFCDKSSGQHSQKEDAFRNILTLQSLLENSPGDFPDELREEIVKRLRQIFSFVRDEGKLSRKLIECVNTFLLRDGPNLGPLSLELHNVVRQFVFRCWLATHDKSLKEILAFYARLQLNLMRDSSESSSLVEQLLDVVSRELDLGSSTGSASWGDSTKVDKFGTLSGYQNGLVELAADVFYRASGNTSRLSLAGKRARGQHTTSRLVEALTEGKWLWCATFCCLVRTYCTRISQDLLVYWFQAICADFQRFLNCASMRCSYDGLLWTLRGLQELSSILLFPDASAEIPSKSPFSSTELERGWQMIWSSLIHALATFSNLSTVVDAILVLLGSIISSRRINVGILPQEVWDHQLFRHIRSESALFFIACYFSRMGCQGNLQDDLHLRRNLLRAVFDILSGKGPFTLNERMVWLLPAASFALCAGRTTSIQFHEEHLPTYAEWDTNKVANGVVKMDDLDAERTFGPFECSVEVLTRIYSSSSKTSDSHFSDGVQLPKILRDPLFHDMDVYVLNIIQEKDSEKGPLSDVFMECCLLCHFIHGSSIMRKGEGSCLFVSKACRYLLGVLDYAVESVLKSFNDFQWLSSLGFGADFNDKSSIVVSFRSLMNSPMFTGGRNQYCSPADYDAAVHSLKKLLRSLAQVYTKYTEYAWNMPCQVFPSKSSAPDSPDVNRIMDMDLDLTEDTKDMDIMAAGGKATPSMPISLVDWKLGMISLISCVSPVVQFSTWEVLYNLLENECDPKVVESILYSLCRLSCLTWMPRIIDLVNFVDSLINTQVKLKCNCLNIVTDLQVLLHTLYTSKLDSSGCQTKEGESDQFLVQLGAMVNKTAEYGLLDWFGRVRLINCICNFLLLNPQIGQAMIERLLLMLTDPDYRVRFVLARKIGLLFQTWDGHEALFQDICSNFGVVLVASSREKMVTARDVLAAGPQPSTKMETVIITLMHLAFHSEKIELEAIFMMCTVSAIDPCHRELITAALDNLSTQLHYPSRFKYLEELFGPILFCWIACGVSLAALVETRQLFILDAEAKYFIQFCSHWLLPALLVHGDHANLNWVAKITGRPLAVMVRENFVPIFSICMGLHCSKTSECEKGAIELQNSILHVAEISENERDKLIKQNMVAIVSFSFSVASCCSEPPLPFFSRDTVARAIQTIVDGFLEMSDFPVNSGLIDRINIFRPDRVFMFIVEIHYKISAACHHRRTRHHLAALEVLTSILGHRASVPSSFNYLCNLIGKFISYHALQDQCCVIFSYLLDSFISNSTKEAVSVLGEQLQFLVSKLVTCCINAETNIKGSGPSVALNLLHKLIVDADSSLYDDIRDLEPFPDMDIFRVLREFHIGLCEDYSPRNHLLKCARRSCYLPPRFLSWSLQALHKKFIAVEASREDNNIKTADIVWHSDNEIVNAVWTLVHMSASDEADSMRSLVSDFVSKVGIGDPHSVVFHLPGKLGSFHGSQSMSHDIGSKFRSCADNGISDETLIALLKILKRYLLDESVKIIDVTSQTLRGILSTERGQRALSSFDSCDRSLIEVHGRGVDLDIVENILLDHQKKIKADSISLEKSEVWSTENKNFETWICQLVYSLIAFCEDVTIRLCQHIALLKSEVSELLFPSVVVSLAVRTGTDVNLYKLISTQVKEYIFIESNKLTKSKQIMLNVLNDLRMCYVLERLSFSGQTKRESSRSAKNSSYNSRSSSASINVRDVATASNGIAGSVTTTWDKVYWLSIDYLVVAKSAVACGSYFTAFMYVEHWCEDQFGSLTLGDPDFSYSDMLPSHVEILVSAITRINEPDSLYGVIQSNKLTSQIITYEHEGNWTRALEYYDLQARSENMLPHCGVEVERCQPASGAWHSIHNEQAVQRKPYKGLIRSLQQTGCMHVLDLYCQGLTCREGYYQYDPEFIELQYEAAWRAGNWDFSLLYPQTSCPPLQHAKSSNYHEKLHCCLRALQEGDYDGFCGKLNDTKMELVLSISRASEEGTGFIYSTVLKLQILYHLGLSWDLRWKTSSHQRVNVYPLTKMACTDPVIPTMEQLSWLNKDWSSIMRRTQLHMNLLEPFIAFRRVLFQVLGSKDTTIQHLLQSASLLRKGSRLSQAAASLHEFKFLCARSDGQHQIPDWLGRIEEAKLLHAQGQHEVAINLASYVLQNYQLKEEASDVYRLIGKWLAETRSSNSRTILEKYLKPAVSLAEGQSSKMCKKVIERQSQTWFHLAHYADALFKSYEERLSSSEWQAAMRLRKHKTKELDALIKRLKSSTKGDKIDYSLKIQELQKQLSMDKEEAEKLQDDRDNFLKLSLEGYKRCLVIGDKYDVRVVFRLVSMWFNLSSHKSIIDNMLSTIDEVQSYKFVPLVYQIASRLGISRDESGSRSFQLALVSLVRKMATDHPYHTIFQLLALANGDRIKDNQRSRNSFVVDMDKKHAAENILQDLSDCHGPIIRQMKQMVEIYIKLAELETRREDTNKRVTLPREIRSVKRLELVPVVTATIPIDRSCQYNEGSFPYFNGLSDSITVMNGINAPKVVECFGSDGRKYKQLAKSGNDDLRQDAVMEQFFGLVNTFLLNNRDTWKRRLGVRTYKVIPFTPSAGVLEWVDGTIPLGDYLIGSSRNGGAHGRYGIGDWQYPKCREHMSNAKDKRKAFVEVCANFRPVMHYFFLEKFLQPADWFVKRLAYTRSVAASSMVGYIVGLGDRHAMNIIIDQATAEVVHIDLGVAFEQGLMLKTPERVPFRLTRDIIDGMGVTGVEGVFRRCCEETLSVMRTNKEALLTIIEVFIHDPLYKWALSPLKALQRQKETDEDEDLSLDGLQEEFEGNKDAARALLRVKQKLDGYEGGEMRSIHGQAQQLIQDAIDNDRLCQMFPGWGAWM
ncbi:PREDICTED: serine/threonine-protein kinase ATM isoform X2 [Tarenaya hassleriana]|uniref:serine/threonine-protein kinase ATM isoform X2 n=1 Tax=Tarenaya hassleriana TaxID=28532 RepID=UPI0008FD8EA3|nr:PREDICTED: serine/threonine-protein kinase ATM isoform X2 [Tarenaya hassleriana]